MRDRDRKTYLGLHRPGRASRLSAARGRRRRGGAPGPRRSRRRASARRRSRAPRPRRRRPAGPRSTLICARSADGPSRPIGSRAQMFAAPTQRRRPGSAPSRAARSFIAPTRRRRGTSRRSCGSSRRQAAQVVAAVRVRDVDLAVGPVGALDVVGVARRPAGCRPRSPRRARAVIGAGRDADHRLAVLERLRDVRRGSVGGLGGDAVPGRVLPVTAISRRSPARSPGC